MLDRSSANAAEPTLDVLSAVLHDLRLTGVSYGRCELQQPWGLDFPLQPEARFHFVAAGSCYLCQPGQPPVLLRPGDVVLLPHGGLHQLSDSPDRAVQTIDELTPRAWGERSYRLQAGGDGERSLLYCCSVRFEALLVQPLFASLPPLMLIRGQDPQDTALPTLLEIMGDEIRQDRLGAVTVLNRLADVVVARLMRDWIETDGRQGGTTGWAGALRDPEIGRVLTAVHRQPGQPWSVESMARLARLSRSTFCQRFAAVVGLPPAQYVARWRMHVASGWLRQQGLSVTEVAERLGYGSEAAFSRAFKRVVGVPPSTLGRPRLAQAAESEGG